MSNLDAENRTDESDTHPTVADQTGTIGKDGDFYEPTKSELTWVIGFSKSSIPGKRLAEHLSCVDYTLRNRTLLESSLQQAMAFRSVFCYGLSRSQRAFGLSTSLPSVIAITNLSGSRAMYTSNKFSLVRLLCLVGPELGWRVGQGVDAMIKHATRLKVSLLLTFSMPWQSGVNSGFWELRTLERKVDATDGTIRVKDGAFAFASNFDSVRVVSASLDTQVDFGVLERQLRAFNDHFAIVDLDTEMALDDAEWANDNVTGENRSPVLMAKDDRLRTILSGVMRDRKNLQAEIHAAAMDHKVEMKKLEAECALKLKEWADVAIKGELETNERISQLEGVATSAVAKQNELSELNKVLRQQKAEQELLFAGERSEFQSKLKLLQTEVRTLSKAAAESTRASTRERSRLDKLRAETEEDLERRLQAATIASRLAKEDHDQAQIVISKLEEALDRRNNEGCVLQSRLMEAESVAKCAVEERNLAQANLEQEVTTATRSLRRRMIGYKTMVAVAAARFQRSMPDEPVAASTAVMVDVASNTEPMINTAAPLEEEIAKLNDEKDELLARISALGRKKRTPLPSFLPSYDPSAEPTRIQNSAPPPTNSSPAPPATTLTNSSPAPPATTLTNSSPAPPAPPTNSSPTPPTNSSKSLPYDEKTVENTIRSASDALDRLVHIVRMTTSSSLQTATLAAENALLKQLYLQNYKTTD